MAASVGRSFAEIVKSLAFLDGAPLPQMETPQA
jgi:hypothetical protein